MSKPKPREKSGEPVREATILVWNGAVSRARPAASRRGRPSEKDFVPVDQPLLPDRR